MLLNFEWLLEHRGCLFVFFYSFTLVFYLFIFVTLACRPVVGEWNVIVKIIKNVEMLLTLWTHLLRQHFQIPDISYAYNFASLTLSVLYEGYYKGLFSRSEFIILSHARSARITRGSQADCDFALVIILSFYRFGIRSCLATSHKQILKKPFSMTSSCILGFQATWQPTWAHFIHLLFSVYFGNRLAIANSKVFVRQIAAGCKHNSAKSLPWKM